MAASGFTGNRWQPNSISMQRSDGAEPGAMKILRQLYMGWLMIAARFGSVQTLVMLAFFYTTLIGPAWLVTRVSGRDLLDKHHLGEAGSAWRESDSSPPDLERAKLTT